MLLFYCYRAHAINMTASMANFGTPEAKKLCGATCGMYRVCEAVVELYHTYVYV